MLNARFLNSYVNFNINQICNIGRTNDAENHCAHFVCHALGITQGGGDSRRCGGRGSTRGVLIRVHELALVCPDRGFFFASHPRYREGGCLIYVGLSAGAVSGVIHGGHVGFYLDGHVWHYENHPDFERVVSYPLMGSEMSNNTQSTFNDRYVVGSANGYGPDPGRHGPCQLWMSGFPPGAQLRPRNAIFP